MTFKYLSYLTILCSLGASAAVPANYYSGCQNKSGRQLLEALESTVGSHTTVSYDALLDLYKTSDVYPDGKIWDMYSTKHWSAGSTCGNYSKVGDCYNREHSFPKSWFSERSPMKSDAFHVYPTDGKVNGQRSNYPYGECAGGTRLASNNGVEALGRLGTSTFSGYSGKVFEPDDEYKGDFARSYFYMAAAYNSKISGWSSPMLAGNSYPAYSSWAIELLLKWHRQDPVSEKELERNEVVYGRQHNRNPFIDHPEMAEYIWGNRQNEKWTSDVGAAAEINTPADGSSLNIGTTAVGTPLSATVTVRATSLKDALTVSTTGDFSASTASISATQANNTSGYVLTVTFKASAAGTATGTLSLQSGTLRNTVQLTAEAVDGLPAAAPADITDCGFTARWTYIGDADSRGCYQLHILGSDGSTVASYPRDVTATAASYTVNDLDPLTSYTYYLSSQSMQSRSFSFTTVAPIPAIDFYYDGYLYLTSETGIPSETAEIEIEIENIDDDITISVEAPFEISLDHNDWSQSLALPAGADRLYLRLNGSTPGEYSTSIVAVAGDYRSDDAVVNGHIGSIVNFAEDFEQPGTNSYTKTSFHGTAFDWIFSNAGVYDTDRKTPAYIHGGEQAVRFGKNTDSSIEMATDAHGGIGIVTLYATKWASDGDAAFELLYSADGGNNWQSAGTASTDGNGYKEFNFTVNQPGDVRLKVQQKSGSRWLLDDLSATTCRTTTSVEVADTYHQWDAYCLGGRLTVSLQQAATVTVYGVDGIVRSHAPAPAGTTAYDLPQGLYLVAVDGRVRRVVIK